MNKDNKEGISHPEIPGDERGGDQEARGAAASSHPVQGHQAAEDEERPGDAEVAQVHHAHGESQLHIRSVPVSELSREHTQLVLPKLPSHPQPSSTVSHRVLVQFIPGEVNTYFF